MQLRDSHSIAAVVTAAIAFCAAVGSAYVSVATRTTPDQVEHIVEVHTQDKFSEVQRRFDKVDQDLNRVLNKLDRIEHKE